MIVTRTPLRISFFGGGSDLPAYCDRHIGTTLSCTIDKYVYVAVNPKFDGQVRVSYAETENVSHIRDLKHDRIRECLDFSAISEGIEVVTVADVPGTGTGLGSSSALTVGLLQALVEQEGVFLDAESLAQKACIVELEKCHAPIGRQDQYAAAFGGLRLNSYYRSEVASLPLPIPEQLQQRLLLFDTGIARASDAILRDEQQAMEKPAVLSQVTLLADFAQHGAGALLDNAWDSFGAFLHASWQIKRSLAKGITTPEIEVYYERARDAGAYGGKICGAGGGGFLLLVAAPEHHAQIESALSELKRVPFRLTDKGSEVVYRD